MIPYIALFVAVSICLIASSVASMNYGFYAAGLLLMIFSSIRYNIGKDFDNYNLAFFDIGKMGETYGYEPLNLLLIKGVNLIGGESKAVFAVYAAITLLGVLFFIKRLSESKELSVFLFFCIGIFYFATFNQVRQWAAMAMILCSLVFLIEGKIAKAFVFLIGGTLFHMSAAVCLIIPLLTRKYSSKVLLLLMLSAGFIGKLGLILVQNSYYFRYLDALRSETQGSLVLTALYLLLVSLSIFLLGYFDRHVRLSRKEIVLLNLCWASLLIMLGGFIAGIDFAYTMRANMYFTVQLVILVPMLLRKLSPSTQYIAYPVTLGSVGYLYFSTLILKGEAYMLTPFKTWLI